MAPQTPNRALTLTSNDEPALHFLDYSVCNRCELGFHLTIGEEGQMLDIDTLKTCLLSNGSTVTRPSLYV